MLDGGHCVLRRRLVLPFATLPSATGLTSLPASPQTGRVSDEVNPQIDEGWEEVDSSRPQGREAVREALIEAATELFASRGASAVSVRDIAKKARVNHGLVHRHFGSKSALQKEVVERLVAVVSANVLPAEGDDISSLIRRTFQGTTTATHDTYFRILARALLDGEDVDSIQSRFPVAQMLVAAAEKSGVERPRMYVARRIATGLGWLLFEPYIRAATGLKKES